MAIFKYLKIWERWNKNQLVSLVGRTSPMVPKLRSGIQCLSLSEPCWAKGAACWISTLSGRLAGALEIAQSNSKFNFYDPCTILSLWLIWSIEGQSVPQSHWRRAMPSWVSHRSDDYWRESRASLPAVCCVWTPSTWGRDPSVPSSSKAKIGFKGISGFSLLATSNLDGLDPMGKFMISSKFSFSREIPFSFGCFSKLGVLGNLKKIKIKMNSC